MADTPYFPIVIFQHGDTTPKLVEIPERLPLGVWFQVLKSKATAEDVAALTRAAQIHTKGSKNG